MNYRKIWEQHNNQKIPKGYHVHHIDGNHANNHPDNLHCCTNSEHQKIHLEQGDKIGFILKASEAGSKKRSKEFKENLSKIMQRNTRGFKKGYVPWNKGLTKETDKRIQKYAKAMVGKPSNTKGKTWNWKYS